MPKQNNNPCAKCGCTERYKNGRCVACKREYNRRWNDKNPDKREGHRRRWDAANPDKIAEKDRRYRQENPEKRAAQKHRRRTSKTQAGGSFTAGEWKALVNHQNGRCLACGKKKRLTADHVVPVSKGGSSNIENIQGLCGPCNSSKGDKSTDYRKGNRLTRWIQRKLL